MIRTATVGDRPAVRALQAHLDEPAPGLLAAAFDAGVGTVLVADRGGPTAALAGYALVVPGDSATRVTTDTAAGDGEVDDTPTDTAVAYLAELVVAPACRRRGVGGRLVTAIGERCERCDRLRVTTRADDRAARAFYRDQGFEHATDLPGHFGGESDDPSDPDRGGSDGPGDDRRDGVLLVRDLE